MPYDSTTDSNGPVSPFLTYDVSPIQKKIKSVIGSNKQLSKLEENILNKIKSITIVEFNDEADKTKESKVMQFIDLKSELATGETETTSHQINKRGIQPRFRQVAISGYGALAGMFAGKGTQGSARHAKHHGK